MLNEKTDLCTIGLKWKVYYLSVSYVLANRVKSPEPIELLGICRTYILYYFFFLINKQVKNRVAILKHLAFLSAKKGFSY